MSRYEENQHPRGADGKWVAKPAGAPPAASLGDTRPRTVDAKAMYKIVRTYANRLARRHGITDRDHVDTVVSQVCLEVISRHGTDSIPSTPLFTVVSRHMARSLGHVNLGPTDRAAMRSLSEAVSLRAEQLGRELTERETQELADEIRSSWHDAKHRPSRNFLQRARMARMGSIIDDEGHEVDGISPWGDSGTVTDPDTPAGRVEAALNAGRPWAARAEAWDVMAQSSGAPTVARDARSSGTAAACRRIMSDYPGGVAGAVDAWQRAEQDEGTVALFAPFGPGLDEDGADAVCAVLSAHPDVADDLWDAALSASTRPH
ncbi:MAG: hypothetical protein Q4C85_07225 [Actinomyces sp.]|uniref:hypothetical protein n=1 Tax=Actinomyces sp. TaxID=29317 RepID=UPI0026DB322B|nr:hypothetical protein [Actinomyces sp.]MDO4243534.1 hypothetical protein [Actinomyces sp.]